MLFLLLIFSAGGIEVAYNVVKKRHRAFKNLAFINVLVAAFVMMLTRDVSGEHLSFNLCINPIALIVFVANLIIFNKYYLSLAIKTRKENIAFEQNHLDGQDVNVAIKVVAAISYILLYFAIVYMILTGNNG
ncbi:MAG TPA: hypothetical protein PKH33_06930 [bacterium]|nr:hypothetical protein [bacterium]